jgi:hypothetical protein
MSLSGDVADFLLSRDTGVQWGLSRLRFSVDGLGVDPEGYAEMGHQIRQGGIRVREPQSAPGTPIAAAYTAGTNTLSLRLPAGLQLTTSTAAAIGEQAGIVHEITHAIFDYHGYSTVNAVEEAVAYIAETLYATARALRRTNPGDRRADAILTAALAVVEGRQMRTRLGQALSSASEDVRALVAAIRAHTAAYPDADSTNHTDGIFGGLMNPYYPSNRFG